MNWRCILQWFRGVVPLQCLSTNIHHHHHPSSTKQSPSRGRDLPEPLSSCLRYLRATYPIWKLKSFLLKEPHSTLWLFRYGVVHIGTHGVFLASDVTVSCRDDTQFAEIQTQWANKVFESLLFLIIAQRQFALICLRSFFSSSLLALQQTEGA